MDAAGASLKRIEEAMVRASSPLARALKELGEANRDRGTCLVLAHEALGEVLIADRFWRRDRAATLADQARLALVDLTRDGELRRVAVLVEPPEGAATMDDGALALTVAALEVTSALAELAGPAADAAPEAVGEFGPRDLPRPASGAALLPPPSRRAGAMTDEGVWGI